MNQNKKLQLFTKRFFPAGSYSWTVPPGCTEVDVFLVGGGGGGAYSGGGGSGYTKTFKAASTGWRDGGAISITPGQSISIIVGKGGGKDSDGNYSQFLNVSYRANGGKCGGGAQGANGGSGGSGGAAFRTASRNSAGSDGTNGDDGMDGNGIPYPGGQGQGHTTRDFGEPAGKRNAGGGGSNYSGYNGYGGASDYTEGSGTSSIIPANGGGGYGGGGGAGRSGGDGTVLIRYYAYTE